MTPSPEYLIALMSVSAIAVLLAVWCFRMTRREKKMKEKLLHLSDGVIEMEKVIKRREGYADRLADRNRMLVDQREELTKEKTEYMEQIGNRTIIIDALRYEIDLLKSWIKRDLRSSRTFINDQTKYWQHLTKIAATRGKKKEHPSGISDNDVKRIGKALDKFEAALKSNEAYEMYCKTEFPPTHVPPAGPHLGFSSPKDLYDELILRDKAFEREMEVKRARPQGFSMQDEENEQAIYKAQRNTFIASKRGGALPGQVNPVSTSTHNDLQIKAEHTLAGVRARNGKGLGALLPHEKVGWIPW